MAFCEKAFGTLLIVLDIARLNALAITAFAIIAISEAQVAGFRHLIEQAQALFHSHHYGSYHLLLTLSDHTSVGGLEHQQSSDDRARVGLKIATDGFIGLA